MADEGGTSGTGAELGSVRDGGGSLRSDIGDEREDKGSEGKERGAHGGDADVTRETVSAIVNALRDVEEGCMEYIRGITWDNGLQRRRRGGQVQGDGGVGRRRETGRALLRDRC